MDRRTLVIVSLAFLTLISPAARGQQAATTSEDAASWFHQGTAAYAAGHFREAVAAFERAYALKPHAAPAFNRARALERIGDTPRAAEAYALALSRAELRAEDQAEAQRRLDSLQQTLGTISVTGPAGARATIGHLKDAPLPIRAYLLPGRYELDLVRKDGQRATTTVEVRASRATPVEIAERGHPWPPTATASARAPERRLRIPAAAYATFTGSALAAGAGVYFGWTGLSARDEFDDSGRTNAEAHDRAVERRTLANLAFGVAAVTAAVGVVLVYRASTAELQATIGRQGLGFSGSF